jgi:hypothetical protein
VNETAALQHVKEIGLEGSHLSTTLKNVVYADLRKSRRDLRRRRAPWAYKKRAACTSRDLDLAVLGAKGGPFQV